ncbi:MAG: hypothetical protein ACTSRA_09025 [Promethearchaeota archaeon]
MPAIDRVRIIWLMWSSGLIDSTSYFTAFFFHDNETVVLVKFENPSKHYTAC